MSEWQSPRKIEEDIRLYRRKRFEFYMELEDIGLLDRLQALAALRDELEQPMEVEHGSESPSI